MNEAYDVVVIGGSAAGLSGALALGRSRRSVLVIDSGEPRNAPAAAVHNYLGRESTPPRELFAIGRSEVATYGVETLDGTATAVERDGERFVVTVEAMDDGGGPLTVLARRILLATGSWDELPDVPGIREQWGRGVVHCPYCHGWEVRDRAIGVLATSPLAAHQVGMFRQLSDRVTLFLNDSFEPSDEQWEQFAARGVQVVAGRVTELVSTAGDVTSARLASGAEVPIDALAVATRVWARADALAGLGVETQQVEMSGVVFGSIVPVDEVGRTSAAGVFAAGNVTDMKTQVVTAAAAGLQTGAFINADLIEEDTRAAVDARR
ncbi:thioredoxin reductase (NADPH) [Labedella gwakjiensis]|uniref:NAD(P)/FAD-dependent oxidoreductase n=1 Tax=Labedella gwakjiensis TaxID=390269 RepID=A0A2P8GVX2_9MICO|nr:NAD(P)/FAD-dependent oxidoreductase [Labedella gwakjiensis]PSL38099.1 thioredoxin reductase (NADPH) [Labedella gwakjiensis]RUQ87348.1 NAD(P)/FAD-dependent oxidoreductase [Labedella gwakjiensis]